MHLVEEKPPLPKKSASRPASRWRNWLFYTRRVEAGAGVAALGPGYVAAEMAWPSKDLAEMSWRTFELRRCIWLAQNGVMYAGAWPAE